MTIGLCFLLLVAGLWASEDSREVSFSTSDGGRIAAVLYGSGRKGIVFVPPPLGGREFWTELAREFAGKGYAALCYDPRGRHESKVGKDPGAFELDAAAAANYLKSQKVQKVALLAAAGGAQTAMAAAAADRGGKIQQVILLSPGPCDSVKNVRAQLLLIGSKDERNAKYADRIFEEKKGETQYEVFLGGDHGQALLEKERGERAKKFIYDFLEKGPNKGMRRHD